MSSDLTNDPCVLLFVQTVNVDYILDKNNCIIYSSKNC